MKNIFQKATGAVKDRIELNKTIHREYGLIREDKVATLLDLDACFFDAAQPPVPRGTIGRSFSRNTPLFDATIVRNAQNRGLPVFYLPTTLAHSTTLSRHQPIEDEEMKKVEESRAWMIAAGIPEEKIHIIKPTTYLPAIYVGDFLVVANLVIGLKKELTASVIVGAGEKTLEIVRDLRNVPDYSTHFPPRPPGGGKARKTEEKSPAGAFGVPRPI